ncbi:Aminopeptidase N, partial [Gryllus bimaculatus]
KMGSSKILVCLALFVIAVTGHPSELVNNSISDDDAKLQLRAGADDYRLPSEIVSISGYDIVIKPDFFNNGEVVTFTGEVVISGYFTSNVKRLTLHAGNNLRIVNVRIDYKGGNGVTIDSTERDAAREFLHINFNGNLLTSFFIRITYTATFSDDWSGFHKTLLLLTQFEPTMARRAFPCFDEPSIKATFKLTIYAPKGYGALSNTPLDKTETYWGTTETTKYVFQPTAKMSTYTFGFMLYEQDGYSPTPFGVVSQSETSIFSWGPKRAIEAGRADYSLPTTANALAALEQYTDLPFRNFQYNMSKLDQTVIPNLRLQGRANWGLISYRADRLFVDPTEGTEADKELAEEHIANELAHQWFGNLVTPSWWDDAWLSEGFDTYFQHWVVDRVHPDWRALERLAVEQQQRALLMDARDAAPALTGGRQFHAVSGSSVENYEYYVPVTVRQSGIVQKGTLYPNANSDYVFTGFSSSGYVLLESTGYFRVNYDEHNWELLLAHLKSGTTDALAFVEYLQSETDIVPWTAAIRGLSFLKRMLVNQDPDGSLKKFVLHIITTVYTRLGFTNTGSHLDKLLRLEILKAACAAGDTQCLTYALSAFRSFMDNGIRPEPDLREGVLCYGIQEGSAADWTKVSQILATSDIESERAAVISGLGCTINAVTLKEYLDGSLTNENLRENERPAVFAAVFANPVGVNVALDKLVADFDDLLSAYGENALANVVIDLAEYLVTTDQVQKMRALATSRPGMSELNTAYLVADENAFWVSQNAQAVVEALKSVISVSTTSSTPTPTSATTPNSSE